MSEKAHRISVIIPTLDEGKLIEETLKQFTHELRERHALEIIISDGGSTDETVIIARKYADALVRHSAGKLQNISLGRNAGANAAKGEVLLFINADTHIEHADEFLTEMSMALRNGRVSGVTTNVHVYKNEERLSDRLFHTACNKYFWLLNVVGIGMGRGECQAVRRELFFQVGGYNEAIAAGEDFELFVRVRRHGKIVFLNGHAVRESPRRFRKYGYLWISFLWFLNAVSVLFFHRSVVSRWKPVR